MVQFTEKGANIVLPLASLDMLPIIQNGIITYLRSSITKTTEGLIDDEAIHSLCEVLKATLLDGDQLLELEELRMNRHGLMKTA